MPARVSSETEAASPYNLDRRSIRRSRRDELTTTLIVAGVGEGVEEIEKENDDHNDVGGGGLVHGGGGGIFLIVILRWVLESRRVCLSVR